MISSKYLSKFHIGKSVVLADMIPPLLVNSEILFVLPYTRNEPLYLTHNIEINFGTLNNIAENVISVY